MTKSEYFQVKNTMKRDHTKLICDVGELSGLFVDTTTLGTFLQKTVEMVAAHMQCDVCSIYLFYAEEQELILKATKGLNLESRGKVKLKLGEGLTGLAVKEMRAICETRASQSPAYKYFPEIGEEAYESFLAVPIIRGQTRIGAIVVQNIQENYFNEADIRAFRAITSQLANTIEMAKVLMGLKEKKHADKKEEFDEDLKFIKGRSGTQGFALAEAVVWDDQNIFEGFQSSKASLKYDLNDFYKAVQSTEKELEDLQNQIEETLSDVCSLIFTAQILMLKDKDFIEAVVDLINKQVSPVQAIIQVIEQYVQMFEALPNAYLREKKQDVKDIGIKLLENLTGVNQSRHHYQQRIVIAQDLYPSDILKLASQNIKGIILLSGGITSHLSILARSLQIPLIITETRALLNLPSKTRILMDSDRGNIYINPSKDIIAPFVQREHCADQLSTVKDGLKEGTQTKDGTRVKLLSNINLLGDLKAAKDAKAEGIGLYRSEFPFMVRPNFPTEEEQFLIYKKLVGGMPGKEITFRTLDIGGDKVLAYYEEGKEDNPFLGMRSIRFSLKYPDIFKQQLRAILRAGVKADLKIMFPMISSMDEFLEAKDIVLGCIKDLEKEGIDCHSSPRIGMMIELPSVLEILEELASEADFFSVGTNDFVQYMLAIDRTNEKVADLFLPHHPSILRALKKIVDVVGANHKELSICGDMAHDERYMKYFLGIGVRVFSLAPCRIPQIQKLIEGVDLNKAQKEANQLLAKNTIKDIEQSIEEKGSGPFSGGF